jgi:hypothetical protein
MKLRPTSTLAQILAYKQINLTVAMSVPLVLTAQITNARVTNGIVALKYYLQTTPKKKIQKQSFFSLQIKLYLFLLGFTTYIVFTYSD